MIRQEINVVVALYNKANEIQRTHCRRDCSAERNRHCRRWLPKRECRSCRGSGVPEGTLGGSYRTNSAI